MRKCSRCGGDARATPTLAYSHDDLCGIPDDAKVPCATLAAILGREPRWIWQRLLSKASYTPADPQYDPECQFPAHAFYPAEMRPIFAEIVAERAHQDEVWGGAEHDREFRAWEWQMFLTKYLGKTADAIDSMDETPALRRRFVQIAALACAALQHCPDLQLPEVKE